MHGSRSRGRGCWKYAPENRGKDKKAHGRCWVDDQSLHQDCYPIYFLMLWRWRNQSPQVLLQIAGILPLCAPEVVQAHISAMLPPPSFFFLINILKNPIIFYVFLHPFLYREVSYTWADVLRYKESCRKRRLFQGEPRLLCRKRSILFRGKQNLQPKETDVYIITKTFAERGRNSDCRQRFKRKFCYSPDQKN